MQNKPVLLKRLIAIALALLFGAPAIASIDEKKPDTQSAADARPQVQLHKLPGDESGHGFGAIVHNPDYLGIWIATGAKDLQQAAQEAVKSCRAMVGEGCEPVGVLSAPAFAIGYGPEADIFFAIGATDQAANTRLGEKCRETVSRDCTLTQTYLLTEQSVYAPTDYRPRRYAALVGGWAKNSNGVVDDADHRIWVATGQSSWKQAIEKAMTPCVAALGEVACRHFATSGDTSIALYVDIKARSGGFVVNKTNFLVIGDVIARCRIAGKKCELVDLLSPQEEKVRVYDLSNIAGVPLPNE
jgi:hypothetical protein